MTEQIPMPAVNAAEVAWRRMHPLSPLLRGGLFALIIVGFIIANFRDRFIDWVVQVEGYESFGPSESDVVDFLVVEGLLWLVLLGLFLVLMLVMVFSWLSWRFASYRITPEAVESRRGILVKQHRRAPLDRIQSVNLQRSLLARLFGLTEVEVQTGGQGGKFGLQYLSHSDAKLLREEILQAVAQGKSDAALSETRTADTNSVLLSVDYTGTPYAVGESALDKRIGEVVDLDIAAGAPLVRVPIGRLIASILLSSGTLAMAFITIFILISSRWADNSVLVVLIPLLLVFIGTAINQLNRGFNFVLSQTEDGVRIGAGFTSTTTETIPFGRIHAVQAMQPLGWRLLGWWKVRITTAGHSAGSAGQNKLQNSVLPVGTVDEVVRVFQTLFPADAEGISEASFASAATGTETGAAVATAVASAASTNELHEALVGTPTGFLRPGRRSGWLLLFAKRRNGLRIITQPTADSLRIRRGWYTRSVVEMPVARAQSVQLSRPLMHRLLGLAILQAHTVLGPVNVKMRGLALSDAQQAFAELAQAIVRAQKTDNERKHKPQQEQA